MPADDNKTRRRREQLLLSSPGMPGCLASRPERGHAGWLAGLCPAAPAPQDGMGWDGTGWDGTGPAAPLRVAPGPWLGAGPCGAPREGRAWGPVGLLPRARPGAGITRGFTGRANSFYCRKVPVGFRRLRKVALNGSYFISTFGYLYQSLC